MNILLCGYNWAGCRALEILNTLGHNIYVCTHEAPPFVPSLFDYAQDLGISASLESVNTVVMPFKPDVICSIYYRNIIHKHILDLVNGRAFNLHPSLLPSYRGCSSLTWAMINGEKEAGYSYHYIEEGCDTGKILFQEKIKIFPFDNQNNLYQRTMYISLNKFEFVLDLVSQDYQGKSQIGNPTYYKRGAPESGKINDLWPSDKIKRFINAFISPPLPYATYKGVEIKSYHEFLKFRNNEDRN